MLPSASSPTYPPATNSVHVFVAEQAYACFPTAASVLKKRVPKTQVGGRVVPPIIPI
jgi:hypothetical protein